jgi:hypothetical protein
MISKKSSFFFKVLNVVVWFCFTGLCIEAGAMSVNFAFSLFKTELVQDLYLRLDLGELYLRNKQAFFAINTFVLVIAISKAYLFIMSYTSLVKLTYPGNLAVLLLKKSSKSVTSHLELD